MYRLNFARHYRLVKYLLFLNAVFLTACALCMFASDHLQLQLRASGHANGATNQTLKDNQTTSRAPLPHTTSSTRGSYFFNYLSLFSNLAAPVALYFFNYDAHLYKMLLAFTFTIVAITSRALGGVEFHPWYNAPNYLALLLAGYLIWIVYHTVFWLRLEVTLPVGKLDEKSKVGSAATSTGNSSISSVSGNQKKKTTTTKQSSSSVSMGKSTSARKSSSVKGC